MASERSEASAGNGPGDGRSAVRLTRSSDGLVAGVCRGIGRSLGVDPIVLRVAVIALSLAGGAGLVAYAAAWVLLPEDRVEPSSPSPLSQRWHVDPSEVVAIGSVVLGVLFLVRATGLWFNDAVVWPVVLAGGGLAVIWRQAADDHRPSLLAIVGRLPRPGMAAVDLRSRRAALARVAAGVVLVVMGVGLFLAASDAFSAVRQGLLASAGIVAGLALISGPWWLRLGRDLTSERRERIRSEERAEVAAHLHDSVLQTLALIQRNADDPRAVVTMARRQERELRGWLYEAEGDGLVLEATLGGAVTGAAEEVEGLHGVSVDVVTVGDCPLDDQLAALAAAAREAIVNAAKWAAVTTVSVYVEVRDDEASVFVRDWGSGFDLESVAPDRRGLQESVSGRMARHGGTAVVRTAPGEGTEVTLRMRRSGR